MAIPLPTTPAITTAIASLFQPAGGRAREYRTVPSEKPLDVPFTIAVDANEQLPFHFADLRADSNKRFRPLVIRTQRKHLHIGERLSIDYSIIGHELEVGVERKGLSDLYGTLSRTEHRDRFKRKMQIISATFRTFMLICEGTWDDILNNPPEYSQLPPKVIHRTCLSWMFDFPNVHWFAAPGRVQAEDTTFRYLEMFWRKRTQRSG